MKFLDNPGAALAFLAGGGGTGLTARRAPPGALDHALPATAPSRPAAATAVNPTAAVARTQGAERMHSREAPTVIKSASYQSERTAEFQAALAKFSADPEDCSDGLSALIAAIIAHAYCKATCEEFGGNLAEFEFDKSNCRIKTCDCEMAGWRTPGDIIHPRPGGDWGPEFWEIDHWNEEW